MDTNVFIVEGNVKIKQPDNTAVHVRFAEAGVAFCDVVLTPEQAADLSHEIIIALSRYYKRIKKTKK